jgi:hypothetical protein
VRAAGIGREEATISEAGDYKILPQQSHAEHGIDAKSGGVRDWLPSLPEGVGDAYFG